MDVAKNFSEIHYFDRMILGIFIQFISSTNQGISHFSDQVYFLDSNESNCIFDKNFTKSIYSNSVVCLIRCNFNSIKSNSDGGAVVVSLRNRFGYEIIINECSFYNCSSKYGASIYLNLMKNCSTTINNSFFTNNRASSTDGGSMYIVSEIKCNIDLVNCSFENNSAVNKGGCIFIKYFNYIMINCKFINSSLYDRSSSDYDREGTAIYSTDSCGLIINSNFASNIAYSNQKNVLGGAALFQNTNISIKKSFFNRNSVSTSLFYYTKGGAIYLSHSNCSLENTIFFNNSGYGNYEYTKAINGGAISSDQSYCLFMECKFYSNSVYSDIKETYGGAIDLSKSIGILNNCSFINNSAHSKDEYAYGGAVFLNEKNISFINVIFTNNMVYCSSKYSSGGALCINKANGNCHNCSFTNNTAETFFEQFKISGDEPRSLGGAIRLLTSKMNFTYCDFLNNTGFGNAPEDVSSGKGGGLYSSNSIVTIIKCNFINNTLCNYGNKFDIDCFIEGGACYFYNSNASIFDCEFINNLAMLRASEPSIYFSTRIYGGAIFSHSAKQSLNCINCVFKNNLVDIPNNHDKEFAGAVCLTKGILDNCTFTDNIAYNGGDIRYDQNGNSSIEIKKCNFKCTDFFNHQVKSLIHFRGSHNITNDNIFNHNKIIMTKTTLLFDGDIKLNDDEINIVTFKVAFHNNCMTPFNDKLFISNEFSILDQTGENQVTLKSAFESNCEDFVDPTPSNSAKITTPAKTPTQSISQITKIPTPTKSIQTKTPTKSIYQTTQIPIPTKSIQIRTPTQSITQTTQIPIPTKSITKSEFQTPSQSATKSQQIIIPTPSQSVFPYTDQIQTDSEQIITRTESTTNADDQKNDSKSENRNYKVIIILLIAIIIFQGVLILLFLILLISSIKKNKNNNLNNLNTSLIEMV